MCILLSMARLAAGGCASNGGTAKLSQDAAVYIHQRIYDDVSVALTLMDFISTSTKYVESLRNPPKTPNDGGINVDIDQDITANPIQNLLFDVFAATGKKKSIYMGYFEKSFVSYRLFPKKVFTYYDNSTAEVNSYTFDMNTGQAYTNEKEVTKSYDCTGRPWYMMGVDNCPADLKKRFSCEVSWTSPYVDYQTDQLVMTANLGVPRYSGPAALPEDAGGFLGGGRSMEDQLLGVVASDYFLGDMNSILQDAMSEVSSEASDVAYVMTSDMILLAVSDGSKAYVCNTQDCKDQSTILAVDSKSKRIAASASYMKANNIMSDNTLLMPLGDASLVLTVREFHEVGLEWVIVTVASHNYDKSCIIELESVRLTKALHSVDKLVRKAVIAGNIVKYALQAKGGALANPSGGRDNVQAWADINKNNTMSLQNVLKVAAEVFPGVDAMLIGFQDNGFMMYKNAGGGKFDHVQYQKSGNSKAEYYYANPLTGYIYKIFEYYREATYTVTERPWYTQAKEKQVPLFSHPYLFSDFVTIGMTYSVPFFNERGDLAGVVGVDLTLSLLDVELRSFTTTGNIIFGMETSDSGEGRGFNMLASSSRSRCAFLDSVGKKRQTKAYASEEVLDFFVYNAASYMEQESVAIDTSFVTNNFTCSVLNYDNYGLKWRFVEVTYMYNGIKESVPSSDVGGLGVESVTAVGTSNPAVLVLQGFNFTILVFVAAALALIVYRLDILMKMVKSRRARTKAKIDMISNPMRGSDSEGPNPGPETETVTFPPTARRRTSNYSHSLVSNAGGGAVNRRVSALSSSLSSSADAATAAPVTKPSRRSSNLATPISNIFPSDTPNDSAVEKGEVNDATI